MTKIKNNLNKFCEKKIVYPKVFYCEIHEIHDEKKCLRKQRADYQKLVKVILSKR